MRPAGSQEIVTEFNDERVIWFPMSKRIDKKKSETLEVQLFEKKNKLFGKIESEWKD